MKHLQPQLPNHTDSPACKNAESLNQQEPHTIEQFYTTDLGNNNALVESALRHLDLKQSLAEHFSPAQESVNHITKTT